MDLVTLKLSRGLRLGLQMIARQDDVSPGQIVRSLLTKEISRRQNARPPVRADEQLIAPLRARLATDLADATNWDELQNRLAEKGYALRAAGGGLALHRHPTGQRLCKASELGFSYSKLMRRFRAPFPDHPHQWLADRFLEEPEQSMSLIEPFD